MVSKGTRDKRQEIREKRLVIGDQDSGFRIQDSGISGARDEGLEVRDKRSGFMGQ